MTAVRIRYGAMNRRVELESETSKERLSTMAEHVRNLKPSAESGKRRCRPEPKKYSNRNHHRRCPLTVGHRYGTGPPQSPSSSKHTQQPPAPRTLASRLLSFTPSLAGSHVLYSAVRVALEVAQAFRTVRKNKPPAYCSGGGGRERPCT
jgi:hypothetical protein